MSISESGPNAFLVAEPKMKTWVAPIRRNKSAAAITAFLSMKMVAVLCRYNRAPQEFFPFYYYDPDFVSVVCGRR